MNPSSNTNEKPDVVVYTREGCHLCDDAISLLMRYGFEPSIVDIDADPMLCEKFTTCVPVVSFDGKVRFRGRINEVLLARIVDKAAGR